MRIMRSGSPILFFSKQEKMDIIAAIQEAEKLTSGEIRVHLERKADDDVLGHAKRVFEKIGMTKTDDRNGILIFMGVKHKRFAIIGDKGINEKVSGEFWNDIARIMSKSFSEDRFSEGLVSAIRRTGEKLRTYFPLQRDDINELPDEISYSF